MSTTPETVLICCFDFPPNQGIGGRRWGKFAKQLVKKGYRIQVIKADPIGDNKISPWTSDVSDEKIVVHSLPRNYPEVISHPKSGILSGVKFRLAMRKLKSTVRGTIFDVAVNFGPSFQEKAKSLIGEHDIKNVIVTGAPFNLPYYVSQLLEELPDLNIIVDYRDPWITAQNYGMPQLSSERKQAEIDKQDYVFQHSSFVTCPNEFLLEEIKATAKSQIQKTRFKALPHFYDPDEIDPFIKEVEADDKIRFVYGGALYMGLDPYLIQLCSFLDNLREHSESLYRRLSFEIYSRDVDKKSIFSAHEEVVHISPPIGTLLFERLNKADYAIIFLSHHNKDFKTTKYFEFLPFGKPLVYIGEEGEVASSIEESNLGVVIRDFETDLRNLLDNAKEIDIESMRSLGKKNSLERVTDTLISLFE